MKRYNLNKTVKKTKLFGFQLFLLAVVSLPVYPAVENWLWTIDHEKYTAEEFGQDYKTYLELMAWQMGTDTETVREYLQKADQIADPRTKAVIQQLFPKQFIENNIIIHLLQKDAAQKHYFEKPEIKQRAEFVKNFILVQLYLNDIVSKIPIKVTDEELESAWSKQRDENPNLRSIPIEQGLAYMRQQIIQTKREHLKEEYIKTLREKYKVKKNPDIEKIISGLKIEL